jgi:sulfhydrogenase subunit alpha
MANRTIRVDYIARVEGESSLELHVRNGAVDAVRLSIFEPPRFFEALLRGRGYEEVLDIVARICGICPIAYQMSGVHAVENALGIKVDPPIRALRRLFYCGEWIQSHALHIVMLPRRISSAIPTRSQWRANTVMRWSTRSRSRREGMS